MAGNKEVAKKSDSTVAVANYEEFADQGFENVTGDDLVLPFLGVLQSNSPQVENEVGDGGILNAKQGCLHNTVTDEIFTGKDGVLFVPACTEHCFVEWVRRDAGGGFVGVHPIDSQMVIDSKKLSDEAGMKFGKVYTAFDDNGEPTGNQLTETFYVYGVMYAKDGDEPMPVAIAFTSTKISPYKRWMTKVNLFTVRAKDGKKVRPPLFAHQLHLTTVQQKNASGTYANLVLKPKVNGSMLDSLLSPDEEVFQAALSVRDMIRDGLARVSYETQEAGTGAETPAAPTDADGNPVF